MDLRNIFVLMAISLLLFGAVSAQKNVSDFQVDNLNGTYTGSYFTLYLNEKQDSGVTIYKNLAGDTDEGDAYEHLIHDDGREYITLDDDMKVDKNSDNTANFTDYEHAEHGVVEVIDVDGTQYIVVFWAKDSSNVSNSDLMS